MASLSGDGTRKRRAAQSIVGKLLLAQEIVPPRTGWERLLGRSPLGQNCHGLYQGVMGEIAVGARLKTLSSEWAVFHSLPIGVDGWDIDHVLVGPGGIVTINTKRHHDLPVVVAAEGLTVDGQQVPYLRHSEFEEEYVASLFRGRRSSIPPIHPTVVFVAPREILVKSTPPRVTVLDLNDLVSWLGALPVVLDATDQQGIADLFDNPATWANTMVDTGDALLKRFFELEEKVRRARLQQTVRLPLEALLAGCLAIAGVVLALTMLPLFAVG